MKSPAKSENNASGFTLVEIVLVLGITAIIGIIGVNIGLSSIGKQICAHQFDLLRSALFYARNKTITSSEDSIARVIFDDHKVFIYFNQAEIKQDEIKIFEFEKKFDVFFLDDEVIFSKKITGIESNATSVRVVGQSCDRVININKNGAIIW